MAASHDVDIPIMERVFNGFADSLQAGKMDHRFNLTLVRDRIGEQFLETGIVANIPFDEL